MVVKQEIAIVGAVSEERGDPKHAFPFSPAVDVATSCGAARLVGAAWAKRCHGLIAYDARFIEAEVVSACVAWSPHPSDQGTPIVNRQPHAGQVVPFAEEQTHPAVLERVRAVNDPGHAIAPPAPAGTGNSRWLVANCAHCRTLRTAQAGVDASANLAAQETCARWTISVRPVEEP